MGRSLRANLVILASLVTVTQAFAYIDETKPTFDSTKLSTLLQLGEVKELGHLVEHLPPEYRLNFVLKHGIKRTGERGHLNEQKISQSADPDMPRAILWDERTGFSVSYNGGGANQTANNRLDVLEFDAKAKTFALSKVDFPLQDRAHAIAKDQSCVECHGPHSRPIFAMYPDWPAFYGSDNDELNSPTSHVEALETADYTKFLGDQAVTNSRYSPLYDEGSIFKAYGMNRWPTFPFRQNTSEERDNISRSFAFRPSLRLGIVYNRENTQAVFERMRRHANYNKYAVLALHSLLQCDWNPKLPKTRYAVLAGLKADLRRDPIIRSSGSLQLDYAQLWSLFGLKINDVDIRYSYNHEGFKNQTVDSSNLMAIGYIGRYFNAYFDGSATTDELISEKLLADLGSRNPALRAVYKSHGLVEKYGKPAFAHRFAFDEKFFRQADRMGKWIPIPFPDVIFLPHHRETYLDVFQQERLAMCAATAVELRKQWMRE